MDTVDAHVVARALHGLVSWGLDAKQVRRQRVLMDLLPVRSRALRSQGSAGESELARAAVDVIVKAVERLPDPERLAIRELLWTSEDGIRPRGSLPSTRTRREEAIRILENAGRSAPASSTHEQWRRTEETEFLQILAREILATDDELDLAAAPYPDSEVPQDRYAELYDLPYDMILTDSYFEIHDRQHARTYVARTLSPRIDGLQHFDIGISTDGPEVDRIEIAGAKIVAINPPDDIARTRILLKFPKPLRVGQTHTFKIATNVIKEPGHPFRGYFHAEGDDPVRELHMRIRFPEDDLPRNVYRVKTRLDQVDSGGIQHPHRLDGNQVRTSFLDLEPGLVYGFRIRWDV